MLRRKNRINFEGLKTNKIQFKVVDVIVYDLNMSRYNDYTKFQITISMLYNKIKRMLYNKIKHDILNSNLSCSSIYFVYNVSFVFD